MQSFISRYYYAQQHLTKRLLTGIQPTGQLHIGNYLGSITNMLKYQTDPAYAQRYLMVADYHSLTTAFSYDHSKISYNQSVGGDSFQMAKILVAAGIDPSKMCVFMQSQVPFHCELTWIFSCIGPQHWLNTMIQFKQKSHENSSVGLYTYPILMAVDILLYKATHVPVGIDQLQHIELTNKYSERFNKQFRSNYFPKVKYVEAQFPKVMSLVDPLKKMSKSDLNPRSRITLADKEEVIFDKIRRAVTDSLGSKITYEPLTRPGLANLLMIYSSFTGRTIQDINAQMERDSISIAQFKERLTATVSSRLKEIQYRQSELSEEQVRKVLLEGSQKAAEVARRNMREIKQLLKIYL